MSIPNPAQVCIALNHMSAAAPIVVPLFKYLLSTVPAPSIVDDAQMDALVQVFKTPGSTGTPEALRRAVARDLVSSLNGAAPVVGTGPGSSVTDADVDLAWGTVIARAGYYGTAQPINGALLARFTAATGVDWWLTTTTA